VHLVGFIIKEICYDAWSRELKINENVPQVSVKPYNGIHSVKLLQFSLVLRFFFSVKRIIFRFKWFPY
jgi:hypothetical protein